MEAKCLWRLLARKIRRLVLRKCRAMGHGLLLDLVVHVGSMGSLQGHLGLTSFQSGRIGFQRTIMTFLLFQVKTGHEICKFRTLLLLN